MLSCVCTLAACAAVWVVLCLVDVFLHCLLQTLVRDCSAVCCCVYAVCFAEQSPVVAVKLLVACCYYSAASVRMLLYWFC